MDNLTNRHIINLTHRENEDGKLELTYTKLLKISILLIRPIYSKVWYVMFRTGFKFIVVFFKEVINSPRKQVSNLQHRLPR